MNVLAFMYKLIRGFYNRPQLLEKFINEVESVPTSQQQLLPIPVPCTTLQKYLSFHLLYYAI